MKKTISQYDFIDAFAKMGREDNFSYEGKKALFDFLEMLDEDTGSETEMDIIATCCDFTEYENWEEFKQNYTSITTDIEESILPEFEEDDILTKDDYMKELLQELQSYTTVIDIDGTSFIIQSF